MELITNRVKYSCTFEDVKIIISADSNKLAYTFKWEHFIKKFDEQEELNDWANKNEISAKSTISYAFTKNVENHFSLSLIPSLHWRCTWFYIGQGLINQGWIVDFNPIGVSLAAYKKVETYNEDWDIFQKIDFNLNYHDSNQSGEATFNISSNKSLVSRKDIEILEEYGNVKIVSSDNRIIRSKYAGLTHARVIANRTILDGLSFNFKG